MKTSVSLIGGLAGAMLALPAFAAELPRSAVLQFASNYQVPAVMVFKREGTRYTIVSDIDLLFYRIRFESGGTVDGKWLKPAYYREIRNSTLYSAAEFNGHTVTYGKTGDKKTATPDGVTMDLFTLAWQLAASNAALPTPIYATNGKKIYPLSRLTPQGSSRYAFGTSAVNADRYTLKQGKGKVSYTLLPSFGNIPAQISYDTEDGAAYRLSLTGLTIDGKSIMP
ncbi:DUF3108 domain-containing protein [Neisseria perflava]|uniref:DUF3108 domain-containing protein n=1 Tax=Neisseria perflava TaxID=33053 RepID=UPI00209F2C29|nr:DUF3108 domain-containing protein [Neisseria perflava]MCP1660153.1 hypothetical protein [Neisseria perflava]MCP1772596.1 hypothetical protein [Neisseria perflava]